MTALFAVLSSCEADRIPRDELDALLLKLEKSSPRVKEPQYAMCYSPARPSFDGIEYVCPKCHKRTKYSFKETEKRFSSHSSRIELEWLAFYRDRVKELGDLGQPYELSFSLDESEFCPDCGNPWDTEKLGYYLVVKKAGGKTHKTRIDTNTDFAILEAFLKGDVTWNDYHNELKLKDEVLRIKELLGLY